MNNLYKNAVIILSVAILFIIEGFIFYEKGYNKGEADTKAKVNIAVIKQQESEIAQINKTIPINNAYVESVVRVVYKYKTKIIKESNVCESGNLSDDYKKLLNNTLQGD